MVTNVVGCCRAFGWVGRGETDHLAPQQGGFDGHAQPVDVCANDTDTEWGFGITLSGGVGGDFFVQCQEERFELGVFGF